MSDDPPADEGAETVEEPPPRPPTRHSFRDHLLRALPLILAITLVTWALAHFGFLQPFETAALDSWLRLKAPSRAQHVVIVGIDECDYELLFDATSPLDPAMLSRLLGAVRAGGPRVVAVDLDTSHERFAAMQHAPGEPATVWARGVTPAGADDCREPGRPADGDEALLVPGPVLGGAAAVAHSGLAVLPRDADGVVRRYVREVETRDGRMPTLPFASVRLYAPESAGAGAGEPLVLNFAGDRYAFPRISAGDVLRVSEGGAWGDSGPLRGKIVIVGGFYRAARDEYLTPVGPMSGVELVAQAVESELAGGGIRPANEAAMIVLEIAGGILLVWLHHRFRIAAALAISLLAMPVLAVAFSWLAFSTASLWASFVPILVAVLIHQLYDHAVAYHALLQRAGAAT